MFIQGQIGTNVEYQEISVFAVIVADIHKNGVKQSRPITNFEAFDLFRPDRIYVFNIETRKLLIFTDDWEGEALRGPTDVSFGGPNRDILLAASLDNLVVHRFDNVGVRGLKLNYPKIP